MEHLWVVIIVTSLIIGVVPAYIAKNKGKDFLTWYIYGVGLFFFAMIHAIVLPEKSDINKTLVQKINEYQVQLKETLISNFYVDPIIVDLNCPIELVSYTIKVPRDFENAFVNIIFRNLSQKIITAIKLKIHCFDAFNEPVKLNGNNILNKNLQDLKVNPRSCFGNETLIELQDFADTRKIKVSVTDVLFADSSLWHYAEDSLFELTTHLIEEEELDRLKWVVGEDVICYAREEESFWQCVCGRANFLDAECCVRCERKKQFVIDCCTSKNQIDVKWQHRKQKAFEKAQKIEQQRKSRRRSCFVIALIGLVLFALLYVGPETNFKFSITGYNEHLADLSWDGGIYRGKWKMGKPHGKGTLTWPDGSKFVGNWKDGKRHGKGTVTWPSGRKLEGEWVDGILTE